MKRVSVKLPEEIVDELDSQADDDGVSRSEVIRHHLDDALNKADDDLITTYEERIQGLERDVKRLENEKRTLINDREEKKELVRYVEEERSLTKQKAQAGIVTRAKWFPGIPAEGE